MSGSSDAPCIAVWSGYTGGHLFPSIGFAEEFKRIYSGARLFLITSERGRPFLQGKWPRLFDGIFYLAPFPWPSGLSKEMLQFVVHFPLAFAASWKLLRQLRPHLSVGFGSYVAYPGMRVSRWMGIPTLIHEQNQVPGKATQWLLGSADRVASSFPETFSNIPHEVTGLPLRSGILKTGGWTSRSQTPDQKRFNLLVLGGSQGSHRINQIMIDVFSRFSPEEKSKIDVNHIAGSQDCQTVTENYQRLGIRAHVYTFFDTMQELFQCADLAISRAGANTIFELAYFGLPAILIPYPHAGGHQAENAAYLVRNGAASSRQEKDLSAEWLLQQIRIFLYDVSFRNQMAERMGLLARPRAGEELVKLASDLIRSHHE